MKPLFLFLQISVRNSLKNPKMKNGPRQGTFPYIITWDWSTKRRHEIMLKISKNSKYTYNCLSIFRRKIFEIVFASFMSVCWPVWISWKIYGRSVGCDNGAIYLSDSIANGGGRVAEDLRALDKPLKQPFNTTHASSFRKLIRRHDLLLEVCIFS